jgi:hypothetical protein
MKTIKVGDVVEIYGMPGELWHVVKRWKYGGMTDMCRIRANKKGGAVLEVEPAEITKVWKPRGK